MADGTTRAFQLGIIGGCLTHQPGIAMSDLYHRRLAAAIEAEAGIRIRPRIARAFGHEYVDRLDALRERHALDGVLLHLRATLFRRARLVITEEVDGRRRRRLHPALLDRRHDSARMTAVRAADTAGEREMAEPGRDLEARATQFARRPGRLTSLRRRLRRLNSLAGALAGLDRWAADDELVVLRDFAGACAARGLPLFLLGPTPLADSRWEARAPMYLSEALPEAARGLDLRVAILEATVDAAGRPLLQPDGWHLTGEGHAEVARRLLEAGMAAWLRSVLESGSQSAWEPDPA